jgi:CheY-like chemotaxis protein
MRERTCDNSLVLREHARPFGVLLVEDNPDDEMMTRRGIRDSGVKASVSIATDGQQAVEKLVSPDLASLPDLVLLDLKLPRLGGLDVLRKLRSDDRCGSVPVVVFSSSSEPADVENSYRLHANCYVQKPVDFDAFIDAVVTTMRYWAEHVKLPAVH